MAKPALRCGPLLAAFSIILSGILFTGAVMASQTDATVARELAARVLSVAGRLDLARITVRAAGVGSGAATAEFQRSLEDELRRLGFGKTQDAATGAVIEITFTESFQGTLVVAEIRSGEARSVAMILRPMESQAPAPARIAPVTIQLQPLVSRREPILDVLPVEGSLLVLGTENLVLQDASDIAGNRQVSPIIHSHPWPRDPRGRLSSDGTAVQAYLPGTRCKGTLRPLTLTCAESQEAWPLDGGAAAAAPDRNYFEAEGLHPFYSMVRLGTAEAPRLLITAIDGKSYMYNSNQEMTAVVDGLGSDLAAVRSGCGSGVQILSGLEDDDGHADALQAYEMVNQRAVPTGTRIGVPGVITALWPGDLDHFQQHTKGLRSPGKRPHKRSAGAVPARVFPPR